MNPTPPSGIVVEHLPASQRSLRVAYVTETYPPEINGVAATVARVVDGLQRRNHAVQLIRPRQDGGTGSPRDPRIHEVLMRGLPIPRYRNLRMGLPAKGALVRLWSLQRPDVVHVATEGPLGWSALQAALRLKLPVSTDFRTNFHAYIQHYGMGWLRRPVMAYLREFHNRSGCTMVPTESLRRDLSASGFQRLTVVSRGVDTALFSPGRRSDALRARWDVAPDEVVVSCVGRLAAEKNLGVLHTAIEAMAQRGQRARLLLVGDGPLRHELQQRWPTAIFAGERTGEDLAAHYASSDLFLFPSLTETFGNVTAEAMASGLPVVAFDYAGAAQLIRDGHDGCLVPFADAEAFARTAAGVAADAVQRQAVGRHARETALLLSWDSIVGRFESVLLAVMQQVLPDAAAPPVAAPRAPAME